MFWGPCTRYGFAFDADGVPTPRGGPAWSRKTLRDLALDDVYRPHAFAELEGLIPDGVLAALDPDRVYGIAWSGRTRVKKVSNARRVKEAPGREEWIGVPVDLTDSGPDQAMVDEARRFMQNNRRPLPVGDRFFELAHGPLTCAHCGCRMTGFGRRYAKTLSYAYRCNRPSRKGTDCPNRRQHLATALEHAAASLFETYASSGKLMELYEAAIEERDRQYGRSDGQAARRSEGLAEQLKAVEDERLGYLRQNARGLLAAAELERLLSEVDERRETIAAELRRAPQDAAEQEREREAVRRAVRRALSGAAGYDPVHADWAEDPDAVQPYYFVSVAATRAEIHRPTSRQAPASPWPSTERSSWSSIRCKPIAHTWQRAVGVRRERPDAPPRRLDQRLHDRRVRAPHRLTGGPYRLLDFSLR